MVLHNCNAILAIAGGMGRILIQVNPRQKAEDPI
jgi:hypothetical protein